MFEGDIHVSEKRYPASPSLSSSKLSELLSLYKSTGNPKYRNDIIMAYMPMLSGLAAKYSFQSGIEVSDLMQEAIIGFTKGIVEKAESIAYAKTCAHNAMKDYEINFKHTVRVQYDGHKLLRKYSKVSEELNISEFAETLTGIFKQKAPLDGAITLLAFKSNRVDPTSIDLPDESTVSHRHDLELVRRALNNLPEPNKSITYAYFGMDKKEFAAQCKGWSITLKCALSIVELSLQSIRTAIGL